MYTRVCQARADLGVWPDPLQCRFSQLLMTESQASGAPWRVQWRYPQNKAHPACGLRGSSPRRQRLAPTGGSHCMSGYLAGTTISSSPNWTPKVRCFRLTVWHGRGRAWHVWMLYKTARHVAHQNNSSRHLTQEFVVMTMKPTGVWGFTWCP